MEIQFDMVAINLSPAQRKLVADARSEEVLTLGDQRQGRFHILPADIDGAVQQIHLGVPESEVRDRLVDRLIDAKEAHARAYGSGF